MLEWFVVRVLRSPGLVVALAIGVVVVGVIQLRDMPRDVLPEFNPIVVEVQTEALGLSAPEVEQLVTVPLEQDLLNGVAFVDFIRSESVPGLSRIEMVFEPGTDLDDARQVVNERLTQAHALPNVSKPPQMLQPVSSTGRVMMIGLSSEELSLIDLSLLARWTIRPQLLGVSGVANVSIFGQREQQLQVQVDPGRLLEEDVTLEQVLSTTGNALWVSPLTFLEASTPGTGGFFDTPTQRIGVQHVQPITDPEDLAKVPLEPVEGAPELEGPAPRLGDVATVVQDHQPLIGDAVFTDGTGLVLVVEKLPEANALEVTEDLDSALDELKPGLGNVTVDSSFFRPARYIETWSDNVRLALIVGFALVVLALGALLLDWRLTIVSAVSLVLSMAGAVLVLGLLGQTINPMVLAGLALGLLVLIDDAVVSAHGVRTARWGPNDAPADGSTASRLAGGVLALRKPLAYSTVITLIALVPMFVLHGEMGAFLPPVALAYGAAAVSSMLVALLVAPAVSVLLFRGDSGPRSRSLVARLGPRYQGALGRLTRSGSDGKVPGGRPAMASVGVLLLLGALLVPFLDRGDSLVPDFQDRDILIHWDGAPGTSLPEMSRITARAGAELREVDGVANVGAHVGRAVTADQVVGANASELWVTLEESADYDATVAAIEEIVQGYPGIDHSVLTYGRDQIQETLVEPDGIEGMDFTVRAFGYDDDTLHEQAGVIAEAAEGIDGVEDTTVEIVVEEPALQVEVDLDRAQVLGIKPGDVRRTAATLLAGIEVGNLFEDQKVFEVMVQGVPATRNSVNDLRSLLLETPSGERVPLEDVAEVRFAATPNVIRHEDVSRSLDIGVDVSGRDVDAVAADLDSAIGDMQFPLEYHAEILGDFEDRQTARGTFMAVSLAAAIGIFLLLQAAFQSWRMALVVFLALLASLTGGVIAVLVDGSDITIGTLVGFVGVLGLSARMGILLVRRSQQLEDREGQAFGPALVERAARDRLAPLVMTVALVALVFVPMVFLGGRAGFELLQPMAVVVVGAMVTATLVHLFVLPSLYLRFGEHAGDRESFDVALDDLALTGPDGTPDPGPSFDT